PAVATPVRTAPAADRDLPFSGRWFRRGGHERLHVYLIAPGFVGRIGQPATIRGNRALDFVGLVVEQWNRLLVSAHRKREHIVLSFRRALFKDDEAIAGPVCRDPRSHKQFILRRFSNRSSSERLRSRSMCYETILGCTQTGDQNE